LPSRPWLYTNVKSSAKTATLAISHCFTSSFANIATPPFVVGDGDRQSYRVNSGRVDLM
jgi:hypothetical protein